MSNCPASSLYKFGLKLISFQPFKKWCQKKLSRKQESFYIERIIKLGARTGDNAEMAMIELVDFNEIYGKSKTEAKDGAKKTRRGRAKKSETTDKPDAPAATEETEG